MVIPYYASVVSRSGHGDVGYAASMPDHKMCDRCTVIGQAAQR